MTLRYNSAGLVASEVDKAGGSKVTYSSPDTGKSFSYPNRLPSFDYGAGAQVGSPVTIKVTGLLGHVPGKIASDAGMTVFSGVVEGIDEFGIPQVEFGDVLLEHGNRENPDAVLGAFCQALTGT